MLIKLIFGSHNISPTTRCRGFFIADSPTTLAQTDTLQATNPYRTATALYRGGVCPKNETARKPTPPNFFNQTENFKLGEKTAICKGLFYVINLTTFARTPKPKPLTHITQPHDHDQPQPKSRQINVPKWNTNNYTGIVILGQQKAPKTRKSTANDTIFPHQTAPKNRGKITFFYFN